MSTIAAFHCGGIISIATAQKHPAATIALASLHSHRAVLLPMRLHHLVSVRLLLHPMLLQVRPQVPFLSYPLCQFCLIGTGCCQSI